MSIGEGSTAYTVVLKDGAEVQVLADRQRSMPDGVLRFFASVGQAEKVVAEFAKGEWKYVHQRDHG